MEKIYTSLNSISDNEFKHIIQDKTPIEKYLGINIEKIVKTYDEKINENNYKITTESNEQKDVFIKYITLVDFLKYLIGKYKNENLEILPNQNEIDDSSKYQKYIHDTNNYSYVDSFFYYLTSQLHKKNGFIHGIECYDSFICHKENCRINIADDFEYLCDSNFFNDNMNKLFVFEDQNINTIFHQSKKEKLNIQENVGLDDFETLDDENDEENISKNDSIEITDINDIEVVTLIDENDNEDTIIQDDDDDNSEYESDNDDTSSSNSDIVNTDDEEDVESIDVDETDDEEDDEDEEDEEDEDEEEEEEDDEEDEDEEEEEEDDEEDEEDEEEEEDDEFEELYLIIKSMPTQVIAIEKCQNTLDYLLENDLLKIEELESAIFQIIIMLMTYQKIFKFTHNDLHTNNIMYNETELEYLTYKINNKYYRIPTYGKLYKIIDFGRAIYNVNDKLLCSDSFSSNGTAHTQYNFGPYVNEDKPIIEPNFSFDLCRLSCSLFDFICDDINNINEYRKEIPIYDLIFSWLYDDNGRNMLYKSNGADKYPGFKLYKMIARLVHNHLPEDQINHTCFAKYKVNEEDSNENEENNFTMNIDKLLDSFTLNH